MSRRRSPVQRTGNGFSGGRIYWLLRGLTAGRVQSKEPLHFTVQIKVVSSLDFPPSKAAPPSSFTFS